MVVYEEVVQAEAGEEEVFDYGKRLARRDVCGVIVIDGTLINNSDTPHTGLGV